MYVCAYSAASMLLASSFGFDPKTSLIALINISFLIPSKEIDAEIAITFTTLEILLSLGSFIFCATISSISK